MISLCKMLGNLLRELPFSPVGEALSCLVTSIRWRYPKAPIDASAGDTYREDYQSTSSLNIGYYFHRIGVGGGP